MKTKEPIKYREAKEVEEIANDLIPKYHQHIIDFSVKIRYIFVNKTPKSQGAEVWGSCRKVSGLNAFLEGEENEDDPFFVITISEEIWEILPPDKRIALVDHELCHAWAECKQAQNDADDAVVEQDNPVKLSIKPHDLEEFVCIVKRHGLWRESVRDFVEAALSEKKSA